MSAAGTPACLPLGPAAHAAGQPMPQGCCTGAGGSCSSWASCCRTPTGRAHNPPHCVGECLALAHLAPRQWGLFPAGAGGQMNSEVFRRKRLVYK